MAIRQIVQFPIAVLKERCKEVDSFDEELSKLIDDMKETMDAADGLGLAANQIAVSKRVFTMVLPTSDAEDAEMEYYEVVNPEIIAKSGEISFEEGCLSFPGVTVAVVRASHVVMRYQDRSGQSHEKAFDGIGAVCAQHELDHLDGLTFLDRVSPLKRRLTLRAYKKAQAQARLDAEEDGRAAVRWR